MVDRRWASLFACSLFACGGVGETLEGVDTSGETTSRTSGADASTSAGDSSSSEAGDSTSTSGELGSSEASTGSEGGEETTGGLTTDACDEFDAFVEALPNEDDPAAAVATFIREAQYGAHGLPLRCEDRVVFISTSEAPRSVAGDFNDWDPDALPMMVPVAGAPLQVADVELAAPGGLYKFVENGTFIADPLARRYGWDEFGEFSLVDARVDARVDAGHHERWPAFDGAIGELEPRTLRVFVPPALDAATPTLLLHDGQNVFSPEALFGGWQASSTATALVEDGAIVPVLLVAIDNTAARLEEYSHVPDDIGGGALGGLGDAYADFVVDGVLPFLASRYGVALLPETTGVLGSSMGGLISLHLAQRHPDVFGYAGSMSGTLGWGTFGLDNETMQSRYLADPPTGVVLYVDSGGGGPCPGGGSDNYCENVSFADALRGLGWADDADLFYRWSPGAGHNEAAWAARLGAALRDWYPGG
ncbi:MAG: alpha/beta hydrolase-fold protein [Myxococcota bacterium]